MKASELRRWLKKQGCTFTNGSKHTIAHLGDKYAPIPRHPSAEIKTGTYNAILKELGLKQVKEETERAQEKRRKPEKAKEE